MSSVTGGQPVSARSFNVIAVGAQPSNPFPGQVWVDDTPDTGVVPYLYSDQFNLLSESSRTRLLTSSDDEYTTASESANTVLFAITGLAVPTAHMLRLSLRFTTTGTGNPLGRFGLRVNSTVVNTTASGHGMNFANGSTQHVSVFLGRRTGGINQGFFQWQDRAHRVGISTGIPTEAFTEIELRAQMLGGSRSVTLLGYRLWEFR